MHRRGFACVVAVMACASEAVTQPEAATEPEAWTLDGRPLYPPKLEGLVAAGLDAQLKVAEQNMQDDTCATRGAPVDPAKIIWLGRRLAYKWEYQKAIQTFTAYLEQNSNFLKQYPMFHALLCRHRGHRYITTRNFTKARDDLTHALVLSQAQADGWEEDGAPNSYNLPLYTKRFNIVYHAGLAHYLQGNFRSALEVYASTPDKIDDESTMAVTHWRYMALRRVGDEAAANQSLTPIHAGMRALDGDAYLNLTLMYKGELKPEDVLGKNPSPLNLATVGYGVGNWHWYNGRRDEAVKIWQQVVNTSYWSAFGFIAAEAELHRLHGKNEAELYSRLELSSLYHSETADLLV